MSGISTFGPFSSGPAVGGNGVATANANSTIPINGLLVWVQIAYLLTPPAATTDVVITTKGTSSPARTLLSISNAATDGSWSPRSATCTNLGVADNGTSLFAVDDVINVKIDGANADDYVNVWLGIVS